MALKEDMKTLKKLSNLWKQGIDALSRDSKRVKEKMASQNYTSILDVLNV